MAIVLLAAPARNDLRSIGTYIARTSTARAKNFVDDANERFQLLAANPSMGRVRPELGSAVRSFPFSSYLIYYRQSTIGIEVLRVLHTAQDVDAAWFQFG